MCNVLFSFSTTNLHFYNGACGARERVCVRAVARITSHTRNVHNNNSMRPQTALGILAQTAHEFPVPAEQIAAATKKINTMDKRY